MNDREYIQALWERARESLRGAEALVAIDEAVRDEHPEVFTEMPAG